MSCLIRKHNAEPLCDPRSIIVACAAPRPMREDALRQLLALNMNTGDYARGGVISYDALMKQGVGLITSDKTEQLIFPAHDSVRTFIFSPPALNIINPLLLSTRLSADTFLCATIPHEPTLFSSSDPMEQYESRAKTHLGKACLLQIQHKASTSPTTSSSQLLRFTSKLELFMPSWTRKTAKAFWPKSSDTKTVSLYLPATTQKAPAQQDSFFHYARDNWPACNQDLSPDKPSHSAQWRLFWDIAMERNESWNIHPWPVSAHSRAQHLAGMFAYSVANGHLPLLKLALQHKDSLPRDIFTGLLPNHGHLPALHVACKLGHFNLLETLADVCDPRVKCPLSRTALQYAAEAGNVKCVDRLGSLCPSISTYVDRRDAKRNTALHLALLNGHVDLALSLVRDHRVDTSLTNSSGSTSIDLAIKHRLGYFITTVLDQPQVVELLIATQDGGEPLVSSAREGDLQRVQGLCWLMDLYTQENVVPAGESCRLALRIAIESGHVEVVRTLLTNSHCVRILFNYTNPILPFEFAVSRHYYARSPISLRKAHDIVGLLATALIDRVRTTSKGHTLDEEIKFLGRPGTRAGGFCVAFRAAAEIGQVYAIRQLLYLWNDASVSKKLFTETGFSDYVQLRGSDMRIINALEIGHHHPFVLPILLAAVRQHRGVLALLVPPDWDSFRINKLMADARSIKLGDLNHREY
jgi:ankyrin repeat protein